MIRTFTTLTAYCLSEPSALVTELPRVIANKIQRRRPLTDGMPWIPFKAIAYLESYLKKSHRVFEFGSGGSTLFFARRAAEVVSVEHDADWSTLVNDKIKELGIDNVVLSKIAASNERDEDYPSDAVGYTGKGFRNYVNAIHRYPEAHFDLVVVDGRSRNACIREAIRHVKPGGVLLLDNSDRAAYLNGKALLRPYTAQVFYGLNPYQLHPSQTTAWTIR